MAKRPRSLRDLRLPHRMHPGGRPLARRRTRSPGLGASSISGSNTATCGPIASSGLRSAAAASSPFPARAFSLLGASFTASSRPTGTVRTRRYRLVIRTGGRQRTAGELHESRIASFWRSAVGTRRPSWHAFAHPRGGSQSPAAVNAMALSTPRCDRCVPIRLSAFGPATPASAMPQLRNRPADGQRGTLRRPHPAPRPPTDSTPYAHKLPAQTRSSSHIAV